MTIIIATVNLNNENLLKLWLSNDGLYDAQCSNKIRQVIGSYPPPIPITLHIIVFVETLNHSYTYTLQF